MAGGREWWTVQVQGWGVWLLALRRYSAGVATPADAVGRQAGGQTHRQLDRQATLQTCWEAVSNAGR